MFMTTNLWLSTTMKTNETVIITYSSLWLKFKLLLPLIFVPFMLHTDTRVHLTIWVTLVSFILNKYMYMSKYAERVLVIIRQDYGI